LTGILPAELRSRAQDRSAKPGQVAPRLSARPLTGGPGEPLVIQLQVQNSPGPNALLSLGLSPRQAEVLFWLSDGKTDAEIGVISNLARRTVEKQVERILEKLGVENQAAAIRAALAVLKGTG
jgi:DNA-binding CsgD family transcriptional regulator